MSKIQIIQGDAFNLNLPRESVDLIVTSPPYYAFRNYTDRGEEIGGLGTESHPYEYLIGLSQWMVEMKRVLKLSGSLFCVMGDKSAGSGGHNNAGIGAPTERGPKRYSQSAQIKKGVEAQRKSRMALPWLYALDAITHQWVLRADIIWAKNSIPTNAKDRVELTHEYIFHFTKEPIYYANDPLPYNSVWEISSSEGLRVSKEQLEKLGVDRHYAPFPAEIVRRVVSGWCPPDGTVLDPFGGSGTTALVAKILGRNCISVDVSSGYCKLAKWRVFASDHRKKLEAKWMKAGLIENPTPNTPPTESSGI